MRTLSLFYEQWLGKMPIGELERVSLMFDIGEIHRGGYSRLKRLIDVVLAVGVRFLRCSCCIPFVVIANLRREPRSPVLPAAAGRARRGRSSRCGSSARCVDLPGGDTHWTADDDPRITPVWAASCGRPTSTSSRRLINILRGDLSIVGPRPEQPALRRGAHREDPVLRPPPPRAARA